MIAGLEQGNCGEAWNLTHPERVLAIQQRYAEAGSECILTNTFGGSRIMLTRHSEGDHVAVINKTGVEITRQAFGNRDGYVIGDIGPFGGLLEPYGDFSEARVRSAFEEQAAALVEGGADAIIIETQTSLEELLIGNPGGSAGGRAVHYRIDGVRCHSRRLDLSHHDGDRTRTRGRLHGGARRAHRGPELRHQDGYAARADGGGAL